ncbi:MAG: CatB-related O-acetyltransferase [Eubacterium sp.]
MKVFRNIEYLCSKLIKKMRLRAIKNSEIDRTSSVESGTQLINSKIGKHSFCGYDCTIINTEIGSFCSIANGVEVGGATHTIEWVSTSPVFNENKDQIRKKYAYHKFNPIEKRTVIGNDVWIGSKVLVKAGIVIGDGAIVGMGSVVTKDVPSYEIWGGNPAKFIKNRFSENIGSKLLASKWWDLNESQLNYLGKDICKPLDFLEGIESLK